MSYDVEELEQNRAGWLSPQQKVMLKRYGLEIVKWQGNCGPVQYNEQALDTLLQRGTVECVTGVVAYDSERWVRKFCGYRHHTVGCYGAFVEEREVSYAIDPIFWEAPLPGPYRLYVVSELNLVVGYEPIEWPIERRLAKYKSDLIRVQGLTDEDIEANTRGELGPNQQVTKVNSETTNTLVAILCFIFGALVLVWSLYSFLSDDISLKLVLVTASPALLLVGFAVYFEFFYQKNKRSPGQQGARVGSQRSTIRVSVRDITHEDRGGGSGEWRPRIDYRLQLDDRHWRYYYLPSIYGILYNEIEYQIFTSTEGGQILAIVPANRAS